MPYRPSLALRRWISGPNCGAVELPHPASPGRTARGHRSEHCSYVGDTPWCYRVPRGGRPPLATKSDGRSGRTLSDSFVESQPNSCVLSKSSPAPRSPHWNLPTLQDSGLGAETLHACSMFTEPLSLSRFPQFMRGALHVGRRVSMAGCICRFFFSGVSLTHVRATS